MKRKKKQRSKTSKASLARAATKHFGDKIPSEQKLLMELLVSAERAGVVRWILQGASDAFRKLKAEATDYRSQAAQVLRERRLVVVHYLYSLLRSLDADTKAEILDLLVADLWHSSKSPMATDEPGNERTCDYDEGAAFGVLRTMRMVAHVYCELAKEKGCEALAGELPLYATQLVEALNEIVRTRPELVKSLAAERIDWPILAMRHYPKDSDFAELADCIGLASKCPVKPQKRHMWKPDTPLNRYVLDMIVVECWGNGMPLTRESLPYYLDEVLMPLFQKVAEEEGGWENYPEFAAIARSAAKRGKSGVQRSEIRNRVKRALKAFTS
jgi:hypothetical protein